MNMMPQHLSKTACAVAVTLFVAACGGGGDASAPPSTTPADTTPPTVAITDNTAAATATTDVLFTFTFSEDVGTSFTTDDITVTGGSKGAFARISGTQATLVVTPATNAAGTITVSVAAGAFTDTASNANTAAASATQDYNTVVEVPATTIVSFDESSAPTLTGFGGSEDAGVAADPTNATNKVGRVVKSATAESWAGATISICPSMTVVALPFATGKTSMSARVWSPDANVPVRLKVENASDPTKSVETEATTTTAAGWQTLTFNFANQATGTAALDTSATYNKASVFFNFGKTGAQAGGAKTYYIDDLKFVGSTFTVSCPASSGSSGATISFDETSAPTLAGFGGAEDSAIVADPTNAANKVVRITKAATAESWAGTTISNQTGNKVAPIGFTSSNTTVTARVWSPDSGVTFRMKVEDASDGSKSVETDATTTTAAGWQTLTFNFANHATGTAALNTATTYNRLSVFPNFGKTGAQAGAAKTYYVDDINYTVGSSSGGTSTSTLPVTFDSGSVTYTLTGFGGAEDATVVADPAGGSNKVAKVIKSATAESWAGTTMSTGASNTIATIPFSATAKTMTLRVWAPAAGIIVRLKVEDATDATRSVETDATTTVANGWQTLTFNFANHATGTTALNLATTYNRASVFFNFGKTGAAGGGGTYYFDDLTFVQ